MALKKSTSVKDTTVPVPKIPKPISGLTANQNSINNSRKSIPELDSLILEIGKL